jgi:uncharacterized protein YbjT (DUF2867 family)
VSATGERRVAFIAGASGYTGRAVVAALRAAGVEVHAHVRPGSPRLAALHPEFEALGARVDTTPWEPDALAARMEALRPSLVFALLGITRAGAAREKRRTGVEPSYETVDFGLTAMLADACVAARVAPRFVYLSSLGTGPTGSGAYLQWRWKTEEHVRATGLPFTIVRPSFITGDDRDESRPLEQVGAAAASVALSVVSALGGRRIARRFGARTNVELAHGMVRAALDPAWAGRVMESEEIG